MQRHERMGHFVPEDRANERCRSYNANQPVQNRTCAGRIVRKYAHGEDVRNKQRNEGQADVDFDLDFANPPNCPTASWHHRLTSLPATNNPYINARCVSAENVLPHVIIKP